MKIMRWVRRENAKPGESKFVLAKPAVAKAVCDLCLDYAACQPIHAGYKVCQKCQKQFWPETIRGKR